MKRLSLIRRATLTAVTLFTLLGMHASSAPAQEGGGGGAVGVGTEPLARLRTRMVSLVRNGPPRRRRSCLDRASPDRREGCKRDRISCRGER